MSENGYLLPLTERERALLCGLIRCRYDDMSRVLIEYGGPAPETSNVRRDYALLIERLCALEPIGTGGTTEGNG